MYIRELNIKNVKRLDDFKLSFLRDDKPRMWTVLIGENGTAKTTLLQTIAMTASGPALINELAGNVALHFNNRRRPRSTAEIVAHYEFGAFSRSERWHPTWEPHPVIEEPRGPELISKVWLTPRTTTFRARSWYKWQAERSADEQDPLDAARAPTPPRPGWFVATYGTNRFAPEPGAAVELGRASISRMKPVFRPHDPITSTHFLAHFGARTNRSRRFSAMLERVLIGTGILPDEVKRLELRGRGGVTVPADIVERDRFVQRMGDQEVKVPLIAFAHGLQSTISWVADLLGHVLLETDEELEPEKIEGLVLIDEIDLFLHPSWQVNLIAALKKMFPLVQFIVTTHSPAMLSAFEPDEIVRLKVDWNEEDRTGDGYVKRFAPDETTGELSPVDSPGDIAAQPDARMLTGSELYEEYFELGSGPLNPSGEALREWSMLTGSSLNSPQQAERLLALEIELADLIGGREP